MNFETIQQITISAGNVTRICQGSRTLWTKSGLPTGYQQLHYIECTGTQYIATGVIPSNYSTALTYDFHGQATALLQQNGNNYLFGCLNSGQRSGNAALNTADGVDKAVIYIGSSSMPTLVNSLPAIGEDFTLHMTAHAADVAGASATLNGTSFDTTEYTVMNCEMPTTEIYLMWCNGVGSTSYPFCGKVYSFKITDSNGDLVRNFLPCRRTSDNILGLFDTVGKQFYQNAGSGTFTAGDTV